MMQEDNQINESNVEELKDMNNSGVEELKDMDNSSVEELEGIDNSDVENNKVFAALAYILFFLPLIVCKDSAFGKFHANQGLILLLAGIVVSVVGSIIPFIGPLLILPIGSLALLALGIIGIINGLKGEMKRLPLVGNFDIIK